MDGARARIWILSSYETWDLTDRIRWPADLAAEWIGDALCAALLERG